GNRADRAVLEGHEAGVSRHHGQDAVRRIADDHVISGEKPSHRPDEPSGTLEIALAEPIRTIGKQVPEACRPFWFGRVPHGTGDCWWRSAGEKLPCARHAPESEARER